MLGHHDWTVFDQVRTRDHDEFHAWNQRPGFHPHLHLIVPGAGLDAAGKLRRIKNANFLVPLPVLREAFRQPFPGRDGEARLGHRSGGPRQALVRPRPARRRRGRRRRIPRGLRGHRPAGHALDPLLRPPPRLAPQRPRARALPHRADNTSRRSARKGASAAPPRDGEDIRCPIPAMARAMLPIRGRGPRAEGRPASRTRDGGTQTAVRRVLTIAPLTGPMQEA